MCLTFVNQVVPLLPKENFFSETSLKSYNFPKSSVFTVEKATATILNAE